MLENDFKVLINNIKQDIKTTQMKSMIEVNGNLINLYFRLGKIISENKQYGNSFIDNISREMKLEFPNVTGYSSRNLRNMKRFYEEYKEDSIWQQLVAKLPWGHNILLIQKIKDKNIRKIYAENIILNGWSRDVLAIQIESNHHLRIGKSTTNIDKRLICGDSDLAKSTLKDPYIFDFIELKESYKEKELEECMILKIRDVLLELGKGFSFVGNQYKLSTDNKDYYVDLLFYHLDLRCYIVVELKTTDFRPEYTGQLGFYVTAVDEILKKDNDNQTIGLLLCREKDRLSVEWSLKSVNSPIGVSSYVVKEILEKLPTEEDINLHIDIKESEEI